MLPVLQRFAMLTCYLFCLHYFIVLPAALHAAQGDLI